MKKLERDRLISELFHRNTEIDIWYENILEMMKHHFDDAKGKPHRTNILLDYVNLIKEFKADKKAIQVLYAVARLKNIDMTAEHLDLKYEEVVKYLKRSQVFPKTMKTQEVFDKIKYNLEHLDDKFVADYHHLVDKMGIRDYLVMGITPEGNAYIAPNWDKLPND